jgi:hypothetical protein
MLTILEDGKNPFKRWFVSKRGWGQARTELEDSALPNSLNDSLRDQGEIFNYAG